MRYMESLREYDREMKKLRKAAARFGLEVSFESHSHLWSATVGHPGGAYVTGITPGPLGHTLEWVRERIAIEENA